MHGTSSKYKGYFRYTRGTEAAALYTCITQNSSAAELLVWIRITALEPRSYPRNRHCTSHEPTIVPVSYTALGSSSAAGMRVYHQIQRSDLSTEAI